MKNSFRKSGNAIKKITKLIAGLVIGGFAGFGAAMLLAPQSGKKTRAQIRQGSIDLHVRTKDTIDDLAKLSQFDSRVILAETRLGSEKLRIPSIY